MVPKISVVIPAVNLDEYLRQAISSAVSQTMAPLEILLVDDGFGESPEGLVKAFWPLLRVVKNPGKGAASARNLGVNLARGKFVAFLDADDLCRPDRFLSQARALAANPKAAFTFSDVEYIDAEGRSTGLVVTFPEFDEEGFLGQLFERNRVPTTSAVMARKAALTEVGGFDEELAFNEEYDLWLRLCKNHRAVYQRQVLLSYRIHPGNISSSREGQRLNEKKALLKHDLPEIERALKTRWKDEAKADLSLAMVLFRREEFGEGLRLLNGLDAKVEDKALVAFWRGNFLYKTGDAPLALESYREALNLDPTLAPALNNCGGLLAARGEMSPARECFEKAKNQNPAYSDPAKNLALLDGGAEGGYFFTFATLRPVLKPQ